MAAAGNHAQARAQASRVLEGVVERQLHVLGAPEDEHRATNRLELLPWIVRAERLPGAVHVGVQELRREESFDRLVGQTDRIGDRHEPEHEPAQERRARHAPAVARGETAGPDRAEHREQVPPPDVPDAEPRCCGEHDGGNVLRPPKRHPQHDHSPERVSDDRRGQHALALGDEGHPVGERLEAGDCRQGGRAAVPGKVRHQQPVTPDQERNELSPVRRRAAEAVDEDERRPLPAQEIPHADALDLGETLLQTGQFCVRHDGRLSFGPMTVLGVPAR